MRTQYAGRRGLTLIEMLVVISIIVALFAIVAAVAPHFSERQRATRGASQLQGWLLIAKQRALRDGAPRGIWLVPPSGQPHAQYVTQLQYIEQPDAYRPATLDDQGSPFDASIAIDNLNTFNAVRIKFVPPSPPPGLPQHTISIANQIAALDLAYDALGGASPDVILEYANAFPGQPRRVIPPISKVYGGPVPYLLVKLDQPFQTPPPASLPPDSTNYSFYRKAQPIAGEPVLQMPRDIAIDISRDDKNPPSWYRMYPWSANVLGTQPFKILFDPKGQVIGQEGRAGNRICLWVRDVSNNVFPNSFNDRNATDPNVLPPGDNSLITIYTRTGLITAHPIDDSKDAAGNYLRLRPGPTWNPFYFTQDGRSSGM